MSSEPVSRSGDQRTPASAIATSRRPRHPRAARVAAWWPRSRRCTGERGHRPAAPSAPPSGRPLEARQFNAVTAKLSTVTASITVQPSQVSPTGCRSPPAAGTGHRQIKAARFARSRGSCSASRPGVGRADLAPVDGPRSVLHAGGEARLTPKPHLAASGAHADCHRAGSRTASNGRRPRSPVPRRRPGRRAIVPSKDDSSTSLRPAGQPVRSVGRPRGAAAGPAAHRPRLCRAQRNHRSLSVRRCRRPFSWSMTAVVSAGRASAARWP